MLHSQTRVLTESRCLSLINYAVLISVKFVKFCFFANSFSRRIVVGSIVSGGEQRAGTSHLNSAEVK